MKCIRCSETAEVKKIDGIEVEACTKGCGGIWFDHLELKKLDESHEVSDSMIKEISSWPNKTVDRNRRLNCPKCTGITLMRFFYSVKRQVEVDHCAKCGGYWLDASELAHIHKEFKSEKERIAAFDKLFEAEMAPQFAELREKQSAHSMNEVGTLLRFLAPSYYVKRLHRIWTRE